MSLISVNFSRHEHPVDSAIPRWTIADLINLPIYESTYRLGAVGWTDIDWNHPGTAALPVAAFELIGEMLKFASKFGAPNSLTVRRERKDESGNVVEAVTLPKVRLFATNLVKRCKDFGMDPDAMLPDNELFAPSNCIAILITVVSHDPDLKIINLLRCMVRENAEKRGEARGQMLVEEIHAKIPALNVPSELDSDEEDGAAEEADGDALEAAAGDGGAGSSARGGGGGGAKKKRKPPKRSGPPKRDRRGGGGGGAGLRSQRAARMAWISEVYREYDELYRAMQLLLDCTYGNVPGWQRALDDPAFRARGSLDAEIDSGNPAVDLSVALSLQNVLNHIKSVHCPRTSNDQLSPEAYWSEDGAFFVFPRPTLTWEFRMALASASSISAMAFPWCSVSHLKNCACVCASSLGMDNFETCMQGIENGEYVPESGGNKRRRNSPGWRGDSTEGCGEDSRDGSGGPGSRPEDPDATFRRNMEASGLVPPQRRRKSVARTLDEQSDCTYANLAMTATDDQHKFGPHAELANIDNHEIARNPVMEIGDITAAALRYIESYRMYWNADVASAVAYSSSRSSRRTRPAPAPGPAPMACSEDTRAGTFDDDCIPPEVIAARASSSSSAMRMDEGTTDGERSPQTPPDWSGESQNVLSRCRKAIRGVEQAAITKLASILDTSARIPDNLKTCIQFVRKRRVLGIGFGAHSRTLGIFGNFLATFLANFKQDAVASNQMPLFMLYLAAHSASISPAVNTICMHLAFVGCFGGGKSHLFRLVQRLCTTGVVDLLIGSSTQGLIPAATPDEDGGAIAPGPTMKLIDELGSTMTSSRLTEASENANRMMMSIMTHSDGMIMYATRQKRGDAIVPVQTDVETTVCYCGGTNALLDAKGISARLIRQKLVPTAGAARGPEDMMCAQRASDSTSTTIHEDAKRLHAACMLYHYAMYCRANGRPCDTLLLVYTEAAMSYLKHNRPELVERIRIQEVSLTIGYVLAVIKAVLCVYSSHYGIVSSVDKPFDPEQLRKECAPFAIVDEEMAFFIIDFAIRSALDNMSSDVLRWIAVSYGGYPFLGWLRESDRRRMDSTDSDPAMFDEWNRPPGVPRPPPESEQQQQQQTPAAAATQTRPQQHQPQIPQQPQPPAAASSSSQAPAQQVPDPSRQQPQDPPHRDMRPKRTLPELVRALANMPHELVFPENADAALAEMVKPSKLAKKSSRPAAPKAGSGGGGVSTPEEYLEKYGNPQQYALFGLADESDANARARALFDGKYAQMRHKYKDAMVQSRVDNGDGTWSVQRDVMIDPNYINVECSIPYLAQMYIRSHPTSKMKTEDIAAELASLARNGRVMTAHMLPLVPLGHPDALVEIERHRVSLWHDERVAKLSHHAPVVIPYDGGIFVLIEALLDSPDRVSEEVLRYLCNESTRDATVVLSEPEKLAPHVAKTFHARNVPGRKLRIGNPLYASDSEVAVLSEEVKAAVRASGIGRLVEWGKDSEVAAITKYFAAHGFDERDKNPNDYTLASICRRFIIPNATADDYPANIVADVKAFDAAVKAAQERCEADSSDAMQARRLREAKPAQVEPPRSATESESGLTAALGMLSLGEPRKPAQGPPKSATGQIPIPQRYRVQHPGDQGGRPNSVTIS